MAILPAPIIPMSREFHEKVADFCCRNLDCLVDTRRWHCPLSAQQQPATLPVTVATPLAKRITQWDEFSGRFEAVESVEVRPRVSGFIDSVHFKDGQIVKAGELLFTIDKRPFQIALESAQAEIARTTSALFALSVEGHAMAAVR